VKAIKKAKLRLDRESLVDLDRRALATAIGGVGQPQPTMQTGCTGCTNCHPCAPGEAACSTQNVPTATRC